MLRVALLSPAYWPEVRRGTERFARELADGLIARGHRPRLITSHPGARSVRAEDGLEVVRTRRPPEGPLRALGLEHHLTHVPLSLRELRRGDDELAHALYHADSLAAAAWSARTGRPHVFSFMGIPREGTLDHRRLTRRILLRAIQRADAFAVLSQTAAERFRALAGVEPRVIPPGVDLDAFVPGAGRAEQPTIFCAADAGEPRKRVALLIDAFRQLRRERPEARLVLSRPRGGGALAPTPGVELRDVDDRAALAAAYREAWVSALPSYSEAFGLVIVESLACGTPVVGSERDAIPEVIDRPQIGTTFHGDAPEELARALLETLDLAAAPGTAAACRARAEEFSTARCAERYEALYEEVLGR